MQTLLVMQIPSSCYQNIFLGFFIMSLAKRPPATYVVQNKYL